MKTKLKQKALAIAWGVAWVVFGLLITAFVVLAGPPISTLPICYFPGAIAIAWGGYQLFHLP